MSWVIVSDLTSLMRFQRLIENLTKTQEQCLCIETRETRKKTVIQTEL